jgi:hypothetical protein
MPEFDIERRQREEARWRILRVLDAGGPHPVVDTLIWRTLTEVKLPVSMRDVRRELDFLSSLELVHLSDQDTQEWLAKLTGKGMQVVEYYIPAPPGINRPPRM